MIEEIVALAKALCESGDGEAAFLERACGAALERWTGRLRTGVAAADCGDALVCAAAATAAADTVAARGGSVASFTAGAVRVQGRSAAEQATLAAALRETAERLMAPYATAADFCFRGVPG